MNPELQKAVEELRQLGATPEQVRAYIAEHGGDPNSMDSLFAERGLLGQSPESVKLDVRQRPESTQGAPYDPSRPGDLQAMRSAPAGLKTVAPEAARGAAALTLSAAQGVPGVEAFEAAMGSLGSKFTDNPLTFRESRDALRAETDKIPKEIRTAAQIAAGGAASRIPGVRSLSPAKAGAAFGAGSQGLSASDMSLEDRLYGAGIGAGAGIVGGKTLDMLVTGGRAAAAKPFDKNVFDKTDAMESLDDRLFGTASIEGAAVGGTSPAMQQALAHPKIAPHVARVRGTERYKNASDAEVLTEVYRSLGRQQRALGSKIASADDYLPDDELMRGELGDLKQILGRGADPDMPTFRVANRAHAQAEGNIEATEAGANAASRLGMKLTPSQVERHSREAYRRKFADMDPTQTQNAEQGAFGYFREQPIFRPNLISGGGVLAAADRLHRMGGLLRDIGTPKQVLLDDILRAAAGGSGGAARR